RKILHELDFNSRQPVSAIAKKLKLSRDIVTYRMKKFEEDRLLLKYYAIIDIAKLGYAAHKQFIRFQNITEKKEEEFVEYIKENPNVVYSASYDGKFDIVVSVWAKNVEELAATLKEMDLKFGYCIAERQMATIIRGEYCVRDYLVDKRSFTKRKYSFGSTPKPVKIDEINKKILLELGKDARTSSVEIAGKLKLSADAVYKRIRKLEDSGVVQSYNIVPNEEICPFTHYKILISLHNLDGEKEIRLNEYCRSQSNIWYFCSCLGPWNFEIDLDIDTAERFRNFLREFKINFSDIIKDYTVMVVYKTNKYNFCPSTPK
ncbi:AsnC family transcriptional regulator, partial [Candidatus Woesearchaeota archaeon]|nr:AsnC family transcriptional regulator [Candidatus Woesearchaeota archaeon]